MTSSRILPCVSWLLCAAATSTLANAKSLPPGSIAEVRRLDAIAQAAWERRKALAFVPVPGQGATEADRLRFLDYLRARIEFYAAFQKSRAFAARAAFRTPEGPSGGRLLRSENKVWFEAKAGPKEGDAPEVLETFMAERSVRFLDRAEASVGWAFDWRFGRNPGGEIMRVAAAGASGEDLPVFERDVVDLVEGTQAIGVGRLPMSGLLGRLGTSDVMLVQRALPGRNAIAGGILRDFTTEFAGGPGALSFSIAVSDDRALIDGGRPPRVAYELLGLDAPDGVLDGTVYVMNDCAYRQAIDWVAFEKDGDRTRQVRAAARGGWDCGFAIDDVSRTRESLVVVHVELPYRFSPRLEDMIVSKRWRERQMRIEGKP